MKKKQIMKMVALLISVLMVMSFTACGGNNESQKPDSESVGEQEQDLEAGEETVDEDGSQEEAALEETGPKEVSAFDMTTTYEYHDTYFDEKEGYDREYSSVSTESSKLVDYKVFPSKESTSCIVVLHFNKTFECALYDAQGNEMDEPAGSDDLVLELIEGDHLVENVDTGETEDIWDYDEIDGDQIMNANGEVGQDIDAAYEGLGEYLREKAYDPNANEDLYDDTVGTLPYSNRDFYRFWRVENAKGTLTFHMKNSALYDDYLTVTSYNDAEQIMKIEL